MKSLVFDSGPLISLAMNNLLWVLPDLKGLFGGEFYITESVRLEVVDEPIHSRRFKFQAMQINELLDDKIFEVIPDSTTKEKTLALLKITNNCLLARGKPLSILHYAEVSAIAACIQLNASALVLDERATREMLEHPRHMASIMQKRLHSSVELNTNLIRQLQQITNTIGIIRSTELAAIALEKGLFDKYTSETMSKKGVLEGILWGLKLNGCSIDERGIKAIVKGKA